MWYYILRIFIGFYSKVYFKKIYFSGLTKLPKDRPLLFACNHPTAFIDPMIVGGISLKARNFMLRGDMFGKGKLAESFLKSIKCIPIYRFQDGFAAMKKNEATLEYCYDLLGKGENIFILAEGVAKHEKRMRPIQKGTARMVFGAYEKHNRKDIAIIPIGMNYTDALAFRSNVYADFGNPIPLSDFLEDHAQNPRKAIKKLTDRLSKEMRKRIIHIAEEEDDTLGDQLLEVELNKQKEKAFPRLSYEPSRQSLFWEKIERLNALSDNQKNILRTKATSYYDQLQAFGVTDLGVAQKSYASLWMLLALLIGLPAFLFGIVGNFLPIKIGKYLAEKKANTLEFNSSLRFTFEMFAYMVYFLLLFVLALSVGSKWWILAVLFLPLFGHFSLQWLDHFKIWREGQKVKRLAKEDLALLENLRLPLANF